MQKLQDALQAAWEKKKTPLLIDSTGDGEEGSTPLETFYSCACPPDSSPPPPARHYRCAAARVALRLCCRLCTSVPYAYVYPYVYPYGHPYGYSHGGPFRAMLRSDSGHQLLELKKMVVEVNMKKEKTLEEAMDEVRPRYPEPQPLPTHTHPTPGRILLHTSGSDL